MKNKKISSIIFLLVIAFLTSFLFICAKDTLVVSKDYSQIYHLTIVSNSDDQEVINQDAEILKKRIENFYGKDVTYSINDNQIDIEYCGNVDNTQLRTYLTSKGELSILNSSNEQATDRKNISKLDVFENDGNVYIDVSLADKDQFTVDSVYLALTSDYLVFYCDYQQDVDFNQEVSKDDPAFFAVAQVTSKLSDDFYISCTKDYQTALNIVNTINAGTLTSSVSESCFEIYDSKIDFDAFNLIYIVIIAFVVLYGICNFIRYKEISIVNSICLYIYGVCYFVFTNYLDVYLSNSSIIGYFVTIAELICIFNFIDSICLKENNNSFETYRNSFKQIVSKIFVVQIIKLISGLLIAIIFKKFNITGIILSVNASLNIILLIIKWFVSCWFASKNINVYKKINFIKILENKFSYIVIALLFVLSLSYLYSFNKYMSTLSSLSIVIALISLIVVVYGLINKKNINIIEILCVVVFALLSAMASQTSRYDEVANMIDILLIVFVCCLTYGLLVYLFIKNNESSSKKKNCNNNEKINIKLNNFVNIDVIIYLIFTVILSSIAFVFLKNIENILLIFISIISLMIMMGLFTAKAILIEQNN